MGDDFGLSYAGHAFLQRAVLIVFNAYIADHRSADFVPVGDNDDANLGADARRQAKAEGFSCNKSLLPWSTTYSLMFSPIKGFLALGVFRRREARTAPDHAD
jgi:hypothetical protein